MHFSQGFGGGKQTSGEKGIVMQDSICDTTIIQTVTDTIYKNIVTDTTQFAIWQVAERFYSSTADKCLTMVVLSLTLIVIVVAIAGIALPYFQSRSNKNLKEKLKKEVEEKFEEEKKSLKSVVIAELKTEFDKFKAISYFTDPRDMQTYRIVKIGSQIWMAENLNYAAINSVCYENDITNAKKYGRLYDWNTAKKICPIGWHLPNNDEWQILINFAGSNSVAGNKLKAKEDWNNNGNGTDDYGFAALPGGLLNLNAGGFIALGYKSVWWSDTEINSNKVSSKGIDHDGNHVFQGTEDKAYMLSVRCIKD